MRIAFACKCGKKLQADDKYAENGLSALAAAL